MTTPDRSAPPGSIPPGVTPPGAAPEGAAPEGAPSGSADGLPTVVVVDDADQLRALVTTQLRLSGRFRVVGSGGTGVEAVALADEHRPDLMLLDMSMPEMDGMSALPGIRRASPGTRVVLFTGFEEPGLEQQARSLGACAVLRKSAPGLALAHELAAVLADGDGAGPRAPVGAPRADSDAPPVADVDAAATAHVLQEQAERFQEVVEEAAIGMGTMTLTGRLVRANKALAKLLRRPAEQLVGMPLTDLISADGAAGVDSGIARIASGAVDTVQTEHALHLPQLPEPVHVASSIAAIRDTGGRPLYLFIQMRDLSEQRAAEEALRRSEERLRLLIEAVGDYAIFMLDPEGRVASWNTGAQRLKGYASSEVIGRHFRMFYPADKQAIGYPERELEIALEEGRFEEEGWRIRKDGSRFWVNVVVTAMRNDKGEHVGFAKVTRDMTERRRMLDEQERAAQALDEANRELAQANERLSEAAAEQARFLAVTAHELRTPIAVIGGSSELLQRHWADLDEPERVEMLESMVTSSVRLRRLLDDLLTMTRLEAEVITMTRERVDLARLLNASAAAARRQRPSDELVVDVPDGLHVVGDGGWIARAIDNLLNNAAQHGAPPVSLSAGREGEGVRIAVSDSGPGVAPAMLERLFDRFATSAGHQGTGLGLYIVRELARAHGGDAWYDASAPRPTFVIALPDRDD